MNYPQHTNCTFSFCSSAEWRQIRGLHEYDSRRCLIIVSTEEIYFAENRIDGVMVSMLASSVVDRGFICGVTVSVLVPSAVDRGFEAQSGQTKTIKLVFVASPLSTPH